LIHVQQMREEVYHNTQILQEKMKKVFYKKMKVVDFQNNDEVMKCDARNEEKGKHGNFYHLWKGPYKIVAYHGNNACILEEIDGELIAGGPVNGRFLKKYLT
jgi:hypothetical protein